MRNIWLTAALIAMVIMCVPFQALSAEVQEQDEISTQEVFDSLRSKLSAGEVSRVEILRVPSKEANFALMTPEMLDLGYFYKFTINEFAMKNEKRKLQEVLDAVSFSELDKMPDIRWGLIFYDRNGNRLGALYFNEYGNYGAIGQQPVTFTIELFSWISLNYAKCFK